MERKCVERELKQRIQTGTIRREDVTRRLAELAFGKANDCVRLALEDEPKLDKLDLRSSSLTGYRRWNSWQPWQTGNGRTWTTS